MKTLWQKIYSFFGFWTYTLNVQVPNQPHVYDKYIIVYWCCFPKPFPWFRKFDVYKKFIKQYNLKEEYRRIDYLLAQKEITNPN